MVVVFKVPVDSFYQHIRTQQGRLPLKQATSNALSNFEVFRKILSSCAKKSAKMVLLKCYKLLDYKR